MFEWMIGASLLMLAVILIRAIFKRKVKASLRYILYALILIRLLMPVSFVSSPLSFMNLQKMNLKALEQINVISEMETPNVESAIKKHEVIYETESIKSEVSHVEAEKTNQDVLSKTVKRDISVKTILLSIWVAGIFGLASYMILSNALYFRKLYITRTRVDRNFGLPVYESRIVKVPSLSGLFSPAIYLPMEDISLRN